jgi:hypothetical protein
VTFAIKLITEVATYSSSSLWSVQSLKRSPRLRSPHRQTRRRQHQRRNPKDDGRPKRIPRIRVPLIPSECDEALRLLLLHMIDEYLHALSQDGICLVRNLL